MTQTITPGRWRGLKATSTDSGLFAIMAFDQRGTFHKMLPKDTPYDTAVQIKRDIVVSLAPHTTAVLLDPEYGLRSVLDMTAHVGLLMALEKSGYSGDSTYRKVDFMDGWTVDKIKQIGASAVKLLVYYHPYSGALAEEIEGVVKHVVDECHRVDLPLFLEPVSYSLDKNVAKDSAEFAQTRPDVVRETASRLSKLGVDILKLEFPVDSTFDQNRTSWRLACEAVNSACQVPWVILSAGVDFDVFEPQVAAACSAGASGFLGGRAIWKEAVTMAGDERAKFIRQTSADRLKRLKEIVLTTAHPWTDYYQPITPSEDWYLHA